MARSMLWYMYANKNGDGFWPECCQSGFTEEEQVGSACLSKRGGNV